ncbi:MAG TPA: porin family protein [Bacteroidales bacterium]|nr:porin family protein [Bacteroidales bacterium]HPS62071.1 porin family protein [Bacteroidales bacterium]
MKTERTALALLFALVFGLTFSGRSQRQVVLNMPNYDQENLFHFGFILGVNQSLVTIRPIDNLRSRVFDSTYIPDVLPLPDSARVLSVNSTPIPGFVVSIVANMQLGKYFELQFVPSLSFGDRTIDYVVETYRYRPAATEPVLTLSLTKKVPSTYINFPLEIKYKSLRYNNFRPYLVAGGLYSLDLASQAKKREQRSRNEKIVKFNQNDIYLEAGVGFDFYNEWFKFGLELKMMYGLFDVLKREKNIYTDSIDRVSSKIFQVSFTFE